MNPIKHKKAIVKLNKNSVVIYYSYEKQEMRYSTGITVNIELDKKGLMKFWDNTQKRLRINYNGGVGQIDIVKAQNTVIDNLLGKANKIIDDYFYKNIVIKVDDLKKLLSQSQKVKAEIANSSLMDFLNDFIIKKAQHFERRGVSISLKDYKSTRNLLKDYQVYQNIIFRVDEVDRHWLELLVEFMSIKHEPYIGEYKLVTKGGMAESTIKKRLDIIAEFYGYLREKKIVDINQVEIIKAYKRTIKKNATIKETLDIPEIHSLYKFKFPNPQHEIIRDIFVFLCLTGIRFQDLVQFDRRFIKSSKDGDGIIYQRKAQKTEIDYNIPLCKIVIEILEKYNYKLPKITSSNGNRLIKEALQTTELFNDYTQILDRTNFQYKQRFDAITLHKGRNSFITNLVDITPLNELMKYTGHKKLSTLQGYIDVKRPVKMKYVQIFDM